jgi:hypothetical protein
MFILGNIVGRLIAAYLLVWCANWLINKFNYKAAIKKTHSKYGYLAISIVFILPILAQGGRLIS